jgi:GT2 family glycosyltransferase
MKLAICVTTRNRPQELSACLNAIWSSTVKPASVMVSDDSVDYEMQERNRQIVEQFPNTKYLQGPRLGVCANRNNAVNAVAHVELVAFIDDDIYVRPNFFDQALRQYTQLGEEERKLTILTGISKDPQGNDLVPSTLTFRGYFRPSLTPESVVIHAAVFPRQFFDEEQWDENIFFGYEDAELCLRALKRGYQILHCPTLEVFNSCYQKGTLANTSLAKLTDYEIYIEAARLYVGIKRYKNLSPNLLKLFSFISIYFAHMTVYLLRRRSLSALPEIVKRSHINRLWQFPHFVN